jgi:hypothetical protein
MGRKRKMKDLESNGKAREDKQNSAQDSILIIAWTAMFFASSFAIIVWRELISPEPFWWPWIHAGVLVALVVVSILYVPARSIWRYSAVLTIIFFFGFGGGWTFGLVPSIRNSSQWTTWLATVPVPLDSLAVHLLRLTPALAIIIFLFATGREREDFFLIKGQPSADAEPSKLLGMKQPEPWPRIARNFAVVFVVFTVLFLVLGYYPSLEQLVNALPLLPVALLIAAINAFNEEFTLRAAPLSELKSGIGKTQALIITSLYFGMGHYYGIPNGIIGVALSAFLGYFLGKSMIETKGFVWAWFIHFLPDIFIFYFLLAMSM